MIKTFQTICTWFTIIFLWLIFHGCSQSEAETGTVSLNGIWRFMLDGSAEELFHPEYDDSEWATIRVPANWELEGFQAPVYGSSAPDASGIYRRTFTVPAGWQDQHVMIRFEGVSFGFEFWIDGQWAGTWESAYTRSEFDITDYVNPGNEHLIAVRVYRHFPGWEFDLNDAWVLSGIYRDVEIYPVPNNHIKDVTITTDLKNQNQNADLTIETDLASFNRDASAGVVTIRGRVRDESGEIAGEFESEPIPVSDLPASVESVLTLRNPNLWTAETPNVYELSLNLLQNGTAVHTLEEQIGIRQVIIDGETLKLNGQPVKLRGVNHHEIHPDVGRALREEHWRRDLELMKAANINAIRTSHYPPHPRLIELCDEYGFYVINEVPFGFGDSNLDDPEFQDDLIARARSTLNRDKNRPSVIIWSVGNENPYTSLVDSTVRFVKQMDPTRPILVPGADHNSPDLPPVVDILAPHYPRIDSVIINRGTRPVLRTFAESDAISRPVISTEHSHSLGLGFEGLERRWEMMQQYARLAGGFIWHFQDQGIRRVLDPDFEIPAPADRIVHEGRYASDGTVWLDERTYLDSNGDSGTDGIVYADREPQPDYWEVRKVYSPVMIREDSIRIEPGQQKIEFTLENRYDFTDLSETTIQWELIQDNESIQGGNLEISLPPRQTGQDVIDLEIPTVVNAHDYRLLFSMINRAGQSINEHVIHLLPLNGESNFSHRLTDLEAGSIQVTEQNDSTIIRTNLSEMKISRTTGMVTLYAEEEEIVSKAPILRVGRKATMVDRRQYLEKMNWDYWEPYLLSPAALVKQTIEEYPESVIVRAVYQFLRPGDADQQITASILYEINNTGIVEMTYTLQPENAGDFFLELGFGLLMPEQYDEFQWLGDGFHASYPGKSAHAGRGVYRAPIDMPHTSGNRANVDLAGLIDSAGNGIGILPGGSDLSVEAAEEGIFITNNLLVSGRGTKPTGMITEYLIPASQVGAVSGELILLPLASGNWPNLFQSFLSE